jgi:hypothetical protein
MRQNAAYITQRREERIHFSGGGSFTIFVLFDWE